MPQTPLAELLEDYRKTHEKRALGGMRALSGFHYQLYVYLAEVCERLTQGALDPADSLTPEALSDIKDDQVYVQVKRTLRSDTLRDALREVLVIDEFLRGRDAGLAAQARYRIHCAKNELRRADLGKPLTFPDHAEREAEWNARLRELQAEGRLLPPVIEPDPKWRAEVAAISKLDHPFDFLHAAVEALLRLLAGLSPEDARNEVVRLWSEHRRDLTLVRALTPQDFAPAPPSKRVLVGERPSLAHLRQGAFMPRPRLLAHVSEELRRVTDTPSPTEDNRIPLFWITGASGSGKSILLLELMQALVCEEQVPAVWLDDQSDRLLPLLKEWVGRQSLVVSPHEWLIFVDDLFAPGQQREVDLAALSRLVRNYPLRYPVVVTCGPEGQMDELRSEGAGAFAITKWEVPLANTEEQHDFRTWFRKHTLRAPEPRGTAFREATGLPISMVFEMAEGDLTQFANRFRDRLREERLADSLRPLLTLNRLYIWPPWQWLNDDEYARLRNLNKQRDFCLDTHERDGYLRLTHPHLVDAIYQAVYEPDEITRAMDIGCAFKRAAGESHPVTLALLRLLCRGHERLRSVHQDTLLSRLTPVWELLAQTNLDASSQAELAVYAAVLSARSESLRRAAPPGYDPLLAARQALGLSHPAWGWLWGDLHRAHPRDEMLQADALLWLERGVAEYDPQWSPVWEALAEARCEDPRLPELGKHWLTQHAWQPDWNYVFRALSARWPRHAPLDLAQQLLATHPDNRNCAYVFEKLLEVPDLPAARRLDLLERGWQWLEGRQERDEWNYVWQKLLEVTDAADPRHTQLVEQGWQWLQGRQERSEWTYVWQRLLEAPDLAAGRRGDLLERGWQWLEGRQERNEWTHVWQKLLEVPDLPAAPRAQLIEHGWQWLSPAAHRQRKEWSFVWQLLCKHGTPSDLEDKPVLPLCHDWLLHEGRGTQEWDHLYEECLDQGVCDTEFLEAGLTWIRPRLEQSHVSFILQKLLRALPALDPNSEAARMTLVWLRSHWDHRSWGFLWCALFERGLRGEVEEIGFEFCKRYPDAPRATFVAKTLATSGTASTVRRAISLVSDNLTAVYASDCLIGACHSMPHEPTVGACCRDWLLAHPLGELQGWDKVFCALPFEHHTVETARAGIERIRSRLTQRSPDLLLALHRLRDRLGPDQQRLLLASMRSSLNNPDREWNKRLSGRWDEVARIASRWEAEASP